MKIATIKLMADYEKVNGFLTKLKMRRDDIGTKILVV